MLNTEHFTYLAGNSEEWDDEMARRVADGEDLCSLQVECHGRGRLEAEVVKTLKGWSVRYATGLMDFGLLFKGCKTFKEAVSKARRWVEDDPDRRAAFVRNGVIPKDSTFTRNGKLYVLGLDYHGDHDKELILAHGERALNFWDRLTDNNEFAVEPHDARWRASLTFYSVSDEAVVASETDDWTAKLPTGFRRGCMVDTYSDLETVHLRVTESSPATALAKLWAFADKLGAWEWNNGNT